MDQSGGKAALMTLANENSKEELTKLSEKLFANNNADVRFKFITKFLFARIYGPINTALEEMQNMCEAMENITRPRA